MCGFFYSLVLSPPCLLASLSPSVAVGFAEFTVRPVLFYSSSHGQVFDAVSHTPTPLYEYAFDATALKWYSRMYSDRLCFRFFVLRILPTILFPAHLLLFWDSGHGGSGSRPLWRKTGWQANIPAGFALACFVVGIVCARNGGPS